MTVALGMLCLLLILRVVSDLRDRRRADRLDRAALLRFRRRY